eukprot:XP_011447703.1 PREDICTED: uncharacterized protein LOC105342454 [Crassostrea gigas]
MASLDMRGCTCVFFYIVITLYTQSTAESRILRGFQDAKMKNRVFLSPPIHVSSKRSKIQCVDACSMVQACISLLYNSVNKSCFLYDQDFTEDDNWDSEENWDYFYIIRVPDWSIIKAECNKQDRFQYIQSLDICFKLFHRKEKYHEALDDCKNSKGGNLMKIDRKLKQKEVENYLDSVSGSLSSSEQIRIAGYHSQYNTWVFDDNEAMTYFNWNTEGDQPDGQTGIALSVGAGYKWHDVSDDRDLKFICEIRA